MKIGVNTWVWVAPLTTEDIKKVVPHVAEAGFDWIEFPLEEIGGFDYHQAAAIVKDHGLGISACVAMGPDRDLIHEDPAIRASGMQYLHDAIDATQALGATNLVGPIYATVGRTWQQPPEERVRDLDILVDNLAILSVYAADHGVKMGIEPLNRFETSFQDSFELEAAAYRVDRLLGIRLVPVTVLREVKGERGSVQLWIEDAVNLEELMASGAECRNVDLLLERLMLMYVLDAVIYNIDRNVKNWLVDPDSRRLFLIDHSRSFRTSSQVPESFLGKRVWLKSGGYIVIDQTEALTSIDVNTGKYVGKASLEDTIFKTNIEAVKEIAYQIRLRNLGGIIIIDFIDMEKEENRHKLFSVFQEAMSKDRAKCTILEVSELGLIQMTRKRVRESLERILCEPCQYCDGKGVVKSPTTVCFEIFLELRRIGLAKKNCKIMITTNPQVADLIYDDEREGIEQIEREHGFKVIVKADKNFHQEYYDVATL